MENNDELTKPKYINGKFDNPWSTWKFPAFSDFLKWKLFTKNNKNLPDSQTLDETLPVHQINDEEIKTFVETDTENSIKFLWIGHATLLINMQNCIILTDPVFSDHRKRFRPVPILLEKIPRIDVVLISHNHYDHLDYDSCMKLHNKFKSNITWFVGMGLVEWFKSCGINQNVHEFTWWQEKNFKDIKFAFTIAQHWSGRGLTDTCKTLWGSWSIIGKKKNIFFAGDTGYCSSFTEIGNKYGPFDLAFIPIGAYEPRFMMEPQHVNPEQAVKIHIDIKSKKSIGIHWGTFSQAYEHYLEPKQKLIDSLKEEKLNENSFVTLNHGQIYDI